MGNKWPGIQDQINTSPKEIRVLPPDPVLKKAVREKNEISRGSILGTILYNTGGIVVEHWIRIYGSGEINFEARNAVLPVEKMIVAEDVLGGLFGGMEDGTVGYFAPATLVWEPQHLSYPQFLDWCFRGDTQMFYEMQRWKNWEEDASHLKLDEAFQFQPELWRLGSPAGERQRTVVPIVKQAELLLETAEQRRSKLSGRKNGEPL